METAQAIVMAIINCKPLSLKRYEMSSLNSPKIVTQSLLKRDARPMPCIS